ncbi:hypothetical protein [Pedobacter sp.]
MRNNSFLILFLCALGFICQAQTKGNPLWQPRIVDANSLVVLETANISINRKIDYPINSQGVANIPLESINEGDSIFISCMGFKTLNLFVQNKKNLLHIIELTPVSYGLKEVKISKSKNKLKEITVGTQAFSITSNGVYYDSSFGLYINNKDKQTGFINAVNIKMFDRSNGIEMPFRLRLYKKELGETFPRLELMEPMILQNVKKKRWFNIDLSHLGIKLPEEGFFIVVEILDKEYYSGKLVKSFGSYVSQIPNFAETTFPKAYNKDNYSITMSTRSKRWFLNSKTEYQFQAKILTYDE